MKRLFLLSTLLLFWLSGSPALAQSAPTAVLNPAKVRAVIVGVLAWQDPSIPAFSPLARQDQQLYQTLLERGVPASNITLLLDEKASREAITGALTQQVAATGADETFLFYYAGHGVRGADGQVLLVPYDYRRLPGLSMDDLQTLLSPLKAQRALLFADCCFSGALDRVADRLQAGGQPAASLTSASGEIPSISNWTFTLTLIDSFAGAASADRDGDQKVTLAEAAAEIADAMRFHEYQQSGGSSRPWFSELVLAPAPTVERDLPGPFRLFDYVLISYEGKKGMGRVVGREDDNYVVELQAYSSRVPLEVPAEYLQPLPPPPPRSQGDEQKIASLDGKYSQLRRTIEVEPDYIQFGALHERGWQSGGSYRGHADLPDGYWVYLYPHWYIWGQGRGLTPPAGSK